IDEGSVASPGHYTFTVTAFDPNYLSKLEHLRYNWRLQGPISEERTNQGPTFETPELSEGTYTLEVTAFDRYGDPSETLTRQFTAAASPPPYGAYWFAGMIALVSVLTLVGAFVPPATRWVQVRLGQRWALAVRQCEHEVFVRRLGDDIELE